MNNYVVYCHTTPSGRKYVGISCDPKKRWNEGRGYSKNYIFHRAIKKYGWEHITHEILYAGLTEEKAREIEDRLIDEWDLTNRKYGYNLQGGHPGTLSEESRKLISLSRMGNKNSIGHKTSENTKELISKALREYYSTHPSPMRGKHHSEEAKQKLRSRVFSDETREKMRKNHCCVSGAKNPSAKAVCQFGMNGELIKEYEYAKLAAEEFGLDLSSIIKCCKGKLKSCGGYRWAYK